MFCFLSSCHPEMLFAKNYFLSRNKKQNWSNKLCCACLVLFLEEAHNIQYGVVKKIISNSLMSVWILEHCALRWMILGVKIYILTKWEYAYAYYRVNKSKIIHNDVWWRDFFRCSRANIVITQYHWF